MGLFVSYCKNCRKRLHWFVMTEEIKCDCGRLNTLENLHETMEGFNDKEDMDLGRTEKYKPAIDRIYHELFSGFDNKTKIDNNGYGTMPDGDKVCLTINFRTVNDFGNKQTFPDEVDGYKIKYRCDGDMKI